MIMLLCLACATTSVKTIQQICRMEPTNRSFIGILHITLRADIKQCKRECLAINTSQCSAIVYIASKNLCLLISGQQSEEDEFIGEEMKFHKTCRCLTKVQSILLRKACFKEFRGRALIGAIDEIYENVSKIQCRKACAVSLIQNNVLCKAAIYYPKKHECMVSSQNRFDLPELFIEDAGAHYLENRCADERFLNRIQNKNNTEQTIFSLTTTNSSLEVKSHSHPFKRLSQLFDEVEDEKSIEGNDTEMITKNAIFNQNALFPLENFKKNASLNLMPKKPIKKIIKHEQKPLRNIERSGYEMNFDENLHSTYLYM
ncbi:PAN domain family protein [Acanthocheilonema viteae]